MNFLKKIFLLFFNLIFVISEFSTSIANYNFSSNSTNLNYSIITSSSTYSLAPTTYSKNIVVIDRKTLTILYEKNCNDKVPMASTTKILTCIIVLENSNLNDIVTVSKKASSVSGSTLGLKYNMKITVSDLLYGLMLRSGNDCAIALAEHVSGSVENFCTLMNEKAKDLDLINSHFTSPHGLDDENHYTTAYELALLTNYALNNETFKNIVSTKTYTINFNGYPKTLNNTNELLGNVDGVYGVKTGFTFNAGRCLVSSCTRNNMDIIVVVLGADTKAIRTKDSKNLIDYIFSSYNYVNLSTIINDSFETFSNYFYEEYNLQKTIDTPIIGLSNLSDYEYPILTNEPLNLHTKIYSVNNLSFKTNMYSKIGKIDLYNNENFICSIDIVLENNLQKVTWKYYFKKILCLNIFSFG